MKRRLALTTFLFLTGINFAYAQLPNRDLSQIRNDTRDRNQAIADYDRRNRTSENPGINGGFNRNGRIPNAEIRSYVLAAQAQTQVKVVGVLSGDTLLVDDGVNRTRIHILGIDAPDDGQTFYEEAKRNLSDLVSGKKILLKYSLHNLKNEFGAFPARIFVGETDIGLNILKNGFAWRNEKDEFFFEKKDDKQNKQAEKEARTAKSGIWQQEKPQTPEAFRRQKLKQEKKKSGKN